MLFYFSFSRLWEALGQMVSAPRTPAREVWVRGLWVNKKNKKLLSRSASLQQRVWVGTSELSGKPDEMLEGEGNLAMEWHPIQEGVVILVVASCYENWDKHRLDGRIGLSTDLTYFYLVFEPQISLRPKLLAGFWGTPLL